MRKVFSVTAIASVAILFSACGDDSSTPANTPAKVSDADMEVDSYGQLPSCVEKRDGKTAYVVDQDQGYICKAGEWLESESEQKIYSSSSDKSEKKSSSSKGGQNGEGLSLDSQSSSSGGSKSTTVKYGVLNDLRDGKSYRTVKIGSQTWMADNLKYEAPSSVCKLSQEQQELCDLYGYIYTCSEENNYACPDGWHLPKKNEFDVLFIAVGGKYVAGKKLKSKYGWENNGIDAYGFDAIPVYGFEAIPIPDSSGVIEKNLGRITYFLNDGCDGKTYIYILKASADCVLEQPVNGGYIRCLKDADLVGYRNKAWPECVEKGVTAYAVDEDKVYFCGDNGWVDAATVRAP